MELVTKEFEIVEGGYIQCYTNDPEFYAPDTSMAGLWHLYDNPNTDKNVYVVEMRKTSGYYNEPFGMIFCAADMEVNSQYYKININLNRHYNVVKTTILEQGTTAEYLLHWTPSKNLKEGYDSTNIIKIVKEGNNFTIFINGVKEADFKDQSCLTGDKIGLGVHFGKQGQEKFPTVPVNVIFLIKENF
ncbi:hypothetical protein Holit_02544 [Hollandina sp. SP2]